MGTFLKSDTFCRYVFPFVSLHPRRTRACLHANCQAFVFYVLCLYSMKASVFAPSRSGAKKVKWEWQWFCKMSCLNHRIIECWGLESVKKVTYTNSHMYCLLRKGVHLWVFFFSIQNSNNPHWKYMAVPYVQKAFHFKNQEREPPAI